MLGLTLSTKINSVLAEKLARETNLSNLASQLKGDYAVKGRSHRGWGRTLGENKSSNLPLLVEPPLPKIFTVSTFD